MTTESGQPLSDKLYEDARASLAEKAAGVPPTARENLMRGNTPAARSSDSISEVKCDEMPEMHYSGEASRVFWERVNATHDPELYALGCRLQDVEHEIYARLSAIEGSR